MKKIVLEESSNVHSLEANEIKVKDLGDGVLELEISGDGIVTHGEHGTLKTESPNVIKYVQQELNPVTQKLQKAFD